MAWFFRPGARPPRRASLCKRQQGGRPQWATWGSGSNRSLAGRAYHGKGRCNSCPFCFLFLYARLHLPIIISSNL